VESKEIFVKAHVRVIRQKLYRFVCKECNSVSERICFPSQPLYCEQCRPPKLKSEKPSSEAVVKAKTTKRKPPAKQQPASATKTSTKAKKAASAK
jgi:septum formation inhibitor MinC